MMKPFLATATGLLLTLSAAFAGDEPGKYVSRSLLDQVPPEIQIGSSPRVNADADLTLKSLHGQLVLVLFTSTG